MKRILIVKLGAIGDVVMAIPAVHALHAEGFEIDWICNPAAASVLQCYSICRVITADERAIIQGTLPERMHALRAVWVQLASHYDLVFTLYYDRRYRLLSLPVRGGRHVRLVPGDRALGLHPGRHHTDEFARILLSATSGSVTDAGPRPQSMAPVPAERLPQSPLQPTSGKRVVLAPGGAKNLLRDDHLRRWPVPLYVELARRLLREEYEVVLTGGPGDLWVREAFAGLPCTDCIDRLDLPELLSLLNSSEVAVTHDSGPLHLAGITRCALVGVFGPVDPWARLPRRPGTIGLWGGEGFACRPCYDGTGYANCQDNQCMAQVTPEMVFSAVTDLLRQRLAGTPAPPEVRLPLSTSPLFMLEPQPA